MSPPHPTAPQGRTSDYLCPSPTSTPTSSRCYLLDFPFPRSVQGQWYSASPSSCSISVVLESRLCPAWKDKPEVMDQSPGLRKKYKARIGNYFECRGLRNKTSSFLFDTHLPSAPFSSVPFSLPHSQDRLSHPCRHWEGDRWRRQQTGSYAGPRAFAHAVPPA